VPSISITPRQISLFEAAAMASPYAQLCSSGAGPSFCALTNAEHFGSQSITISEFKSVPAASIPVTMGSPINRSVIIDGHTIPRRGFTAWAWIYFVLFVAVPVLGGGALLDYALYLIIIR
jgi:hypothetical protein